jgi:GT2 family glycosyltransferase
MKNPLVAINILTYNGENLIEQCLKSVLNQTYSNIEVLVIDNHSIDRTIEKIRNSQPKAGPPRAEKIKIIENKENLGFAAGHNLGINESKGDYVLCLNQDVILDKDFVKYAIEAMEKDDKIGSVQGKLYKHDKILDTTGLMALKNRRFINRGQGEEDLGQYDGPSTSSGRESGIREIFGVDGAAPIYRRSALEDTKINNEYFDEDFFCYKEDIDLAWRMRLYDWKAVYEPRAFAYHLRGAGDSAVRKPMAVIKERKRISQLAKFYSFKNQRLMQVKNEVPSLFFRDFFSILIKELGAWFYVLFFEHYTWKAIRELFKQIPSAWKKREIIMKNKKPGIYVGFD